LGSLSKAPKETDYIFNIIYVSYKISISLFTLIGSKHIDYNWKIVLAFKKRLAQRVRFID